MPTLPTVNKQESVYAVLEETYQLLTSALFSGSHDPKNLPEELKEAILTTMATIEFLLVLLPNKYR